MITLEMFEKIIKDIQKHDKENEILTDILIGDENYGWVSHGNIIVNDLIKLMQRIFKDDNDEINWWLYDSEAGKFVVNMNTDDLLRLRNLIARRPNHKYLEIKEENKCQNIK